MGDDCQIGTSTRLVNVKVGNHCSIAAGLIIENCTVPDHHTVFSTGSGKWKMKSLLPGISPSLSVSEKDLFVSLLHIVVCRLMYFSFTARHFPSLL
jgi:carbonic anhydrase/acetyltransferase-like protein (isoleucine patch superfamily)